MFGNAPSQLAQIITYTRLAQAVGFPPTLQYLDLVLECTKHYDSGKRVIFGPKGRIMANFTQESIVDIFNIGSHEKIVKINTKEVEEFYVKDHDKALATMNSNWISKPKSHYLNFPNQLRRIDLKVEYNDMITLLGRIMGLEDAFIFKNQMFYNISKIVKGTNYHQVSMLSDKVDFQLRKLQEIKKLTMTSYLVYLLARNLISTKV